MKSDADEDVLAFRRARLRLESPRALLWSGAAITLLSIAERVSGLLDTQATTLHVAISCWFFVVAWMLRRPSTPDRIIAPLMAASGLAVTVSFQLEYLHNPTTAGLGYVILIIAVVPPLLLSPNAFSVLAAVSVTLIAYAAQQTADTLAPAKPSDWILLAITAETIGGILLALRLRAIDELGLATMQARRMATIDALTGLLNRHGLQMELPQLATNARRAGKQLYAVFIDIDGLKTANDAHGHEFGDEVLRAVADAMRALAPNAAALCRWGGDEFIGIDAGTAPAASDLVHAMREFVESWGIDLAKWPGTVSIGVAEATADDDEGIRALIAEADAHMYARRRADRERRDAERQQ